MRNVTPSPAAISASGLSAAVSPATVAPVVPTISPSTPIGPATPESFAAYTNAVSMPWTIAEERIVTPAAPLVNKPVIPVKLATAANAANANCNAHTATVTTGTPMATSLSHAGMSFHSVCTHVHTDTMLSTI